MEEKQFCYRYVDGNDSEGRAIVMLWKMVVLRETEKTFWYCHDLPNMTLDQLRKYRSRPNDKEVKRCLKGAARSRYHLTREAALSAFIWRKLYQLDRINLTQETVRLCLKGLADAGHITSGDDGHVTGFSEVIAAPELSFTAVQEPGPVASTYSWGEY